MEDIQLAPKVKPNQEGKFVVYDVDGNAVYFDYSVDAKEALISKDENGNNRFFLQKPGKQKDGLEKEKAQVEEKNEEKVDTRRERRTREKKEDQED